MENNMNMNELEQMREQMQMFRNKIDKQEIINDKLVRCAVKSKMSWIRKYVYFEFCIIPFLALLWGGIKYMFDLSWFNYAFMLVITTIDALWDYRINVTSLKADMVETNSLTETMLRLVEMKQMRVKSFYIMMALLIVWLVWTGIEMWISISSIFEPDSLMEGAAYGGFIGLLIGIPLGIYAAIRIYRKMQSTNDELINQIKEVSKNE